MARRCVVLDLTEETGTELRFRVVFWLPVPAGQAQPTAPAFTGALPAELAPSVAELAELRAGRVREVVEQIAVSRTDVSGHARSDEELRDAVRAALQERYRDHLRDVETRQAARALYGTTYDDRDGWRAGGASDAPGDQAKGR